MNATTEFLRVVEWYARRLACWIWRRTGVLIPASLLLVTGGMALHWSDRSAQQLEALQAESAAATLETGTPAQTPAPMLANASEALAEHLMDEGDVYGILHDLLKWAEDARLTIERAEYAHESDGSGQFGRFRVVTPIRGDARGVQQLIARALRSHRALTLKSVRFARERIETGQVEARVEWVVLVRQKANSSGAAR